MRRYLTPYGQEQWRPTHYLSGHVYVVCPQLPGFSFMFEPGEWDSAAKVLNAIAPALVGYGKALAGEAAAPAAPASGAEWKPQPGWLARDVDRAKKRVEEWETAGASPSRNKTPS